MTDMLVSQWSPLILIKLLSFLIASNDATLEVTFWLNWPGYLIAGFSEEARRE